MSRQKKNSMGFLLPIVLALVTLLTGCVRYDVGINFDNPQNGKIVQQIKIGEQLTSLSQAEAKKWLNSIEERAQNLQGKVKRLNAQEILVTIPFGNGEELTKKFNRFFGSDTVVTATPQTQDMNLLKLDSQLALQQNNFLFLERNALDLTIDLRALGVLSQQGRIVVSPGSLINLEFQLNTPLTAYSVAGADNLEPIANTVGKPLVWQLQPGQVNHIEAVFWLPSPIGIGIAAIILLAILGYVLKYRRFPGIA